MTDIFLERVDARAPAWFSRAMSTTPRIETDRLILRTIDPDRDFEPFAEMMADEETGRYIGGHHGRAGAWRNMCTILGHWQVRGFGFFAVEEKETGAFVGRIGPWYPEGWPAPEVGWTIRRDVWGKGYAGEAGAAAIDYAIETLGWPGVIHLIDPANANSQRVAERLGSKITGFVEDLPPFGVSTDIWGQSAAEWRARKNR